MGADRSSDVPARLRLKAVAWARLSLAWAHLSFKPSPSRQTGLSSGWLGLEPRLFGGCRDIPIEQCSVDISIVMSWLQCIVTYREPVDFISDSMHRSKCQYYIGNYDIIPRIYCRAHFQLRRYPDRPTIKVSTTYDSYHGIPTMQSEFNMTEICDSKLLIMCTESLGLRAGLRL